jgi:hypothetical protein
MASSARPFGLVKTEENRGRINVSHCLVQRRLAAVRVAKDASLHITTR